MSAGAFFWIGFGMVAVAIVGFGLALCRAAALGDETTQRALRQERAARAELHSYTGNVQASPQQPPIAADTPRALNLLPGARGDNFTRDTKGLT